MLHAGRIVAGGGQDYQVDLYDNGPDLPPTHQTVPARLRHAPERALALGTWVFLYEVPMLVIAHPLPGATTP